MYNPQNNEPVTFHISSDGTALQNVSIPYVNLGCVPTHPFQDHISVATIAINPDGSFSSTTTQSGVIGGAPAMFTYTFNGHTHGTKSAGVQRFAGQFREDIAYNNGTSYSCTSNDQSWSATRSGA